MAWKPSALFLLLFPAFPLATVAAVPSTIELRPNDVIKTILAPYGSNGRGRTGSTSSTSFTELQLNLCNSGFASCFASGASIPEGSELIYQTGPNTVTANEICSNDVAQLQSFLGEAWPTDSTYAVFMPAIDKRTAAAYKCKNGFLYGSAVLGRIASGTQVVAFGGKYSVQDSGNEQRIFACAAAGSDHFACTTHLTASSKSLAMAQCQALMTDAIPYLRAQAGASGVRTVVGGDLNLKYDTGDAYNVQKCVPSGWTRKGDGSVQHVLFTNELKFGSSKKYGLSYTDHDGWLVRLSTS